MPPPIEITVGVRAWTVYCTGMLYKLGDALLKRSVVIHNHPPQSHRKQEKQQ